MCYGPHFLEGLRHGRRDLVQLYSCFCAVTLRSQTQSCPVLDYEQVLSQPVVKLGSDPLAFIFLRLYQTAREFCLSAIRSLQLCNSPPVGSRNRGCGSDADERIEPPGSPYRRNDDN